MRALRRHITWTAPRPLGLRASVGCGDRLGMATPGHVQAVRKYLLTPIFAQQSIREMTPLAAPRNRCWMKPCGASFKKAGAKATELTPTT